MPLNYSCKLVTFQLCLLLSAASQFLHAQSGSPRQVVGITGKWYWVDQKGDHSIKFGETIDPNISCVVGEGDGLPVLVVILNRTPVRLACEGKPECEQAVGKKCARLIASPGSETQRPLVLSLAAEFLAIFAEPERYVTPVSRGLEPHLVDGVLALEGERLDLAPAFKDMNPGKYSVRIEPFAQQEPTSDVPVEWSGKAPASLVVPRIKPGLYRLIRLTDQSEPADPGAWALVDAPDRFSQDSAAFHSAEEQTETWPEEVDPRVPGAVLRAYLDSLAKNARPKP